MILRLCLVVKTMSPFENFCISIQILKPAAYTSHLAFSESGRSPAFHLKSVAEDIWIAVVLLFVSLPNKALPVQVSDRSLIELPMFVPQKVSLNVTAIFSSCWGCVTNERMDSSFQCCIKDDSRSISIGVQSLVLNHLKVLCLKGMVLNVHAKGFV